MRYFVFIILHCWEVKASSVAAWVSFTCWVEVVTYHLSSIITGMEGLVDYGLLIWLWLWLWLSVTLGRRIPF